MVSSNRFIKIMFLSMVILLIGAFLGISLGAKDISLEVVWEAIWKFDGSLNHQLVRDLRLPRVLSSILVGGLLALCGSLMQGVTRNPMAEPSLLGISQASTLAMSTLYLMPSLLTSQTIFLAALVGAILGGSLVMLFTMSSPTNLSLTRLLLAGTALSTFFISLSTVIGIISNNSQLIGFLVGGGFRTANWSSIPLLICGVVLGLGFSMHLASSINVVSLGDEVSVGLGVNPNRIRFSTLSLVIVLCAISVAVGKNISFVGLIIPQIVMRILPRDYRYILPCSFVLGGILLVFADILARMLLSPYEMPISIFTSLLGIPFFLYVVRKERS